MLGRSRATPQSSDSPVYWEPSLSFLKLAIAFAVVGALAFLIALRWFDPPQPWRIWPTAVLLALALGAAVLLGRGHRRAATIWLGVGAWCYLTATSVFLGGVANASVMFYPLVVIMLGWLVGTRWSAVVAAMTAVAAAALVWADWHAGLPAAATTPPGARWLLLTFAVAGSAVMSHYLVRSYRNRLADVDRLHTEVNAAREIAHRSEWLQMSARSSQLSETLDAIPDLLFEMDLQGRYVDCHTVQAELLVAPEGELKGRTVTEVMPAAAAAVCLDAIREAHEHGRSHGREVELPVVSGTRWFELSVARKPVPEGGEPRFVALSRDVTSRKRAELALRESEAQLQSVLGATADGILAVDQHGHVIQTNQRFAELWRIPAGMIEQGDDRALLAYVTAQLADPAAFHEKVAALYQSRDEATDTVAFKDGRIFERFTAPLLVAGELTGRVWSFRDVTERERVEQRLSMAIEVTGVLFWEVDFVTGAIVYDEARLVALQLGDGEELKTLTAWLSHVHADDREQFRARLDAALQPGDALFDLEYRLVTSTGCQWLHTRGRVAQRADDNRPITAVGTTVNISARKAVEESRRLSEERSRTLAAMLRLMCDNVPDMIWAKDLEKRYVFANKAICDRLLNAADTSEPVGKTDMYFAERERQRHPELADWHTFGELCQDSDTVTLERGRPSRFEEFGNVKGRYVVLDVHKAPFFDEAGQLIGTVGPGRDITDRRRLEEAHAQAQKLESLGTLAGGIAHDFNNIMAAVRGNADLAAMQLDPHHPAVVALTEIQTASERARELVRRIMVFGRPRELSRSTVNLAQVVDEVLRLLRSTLPATIELRTDFHASTPDVEADAGQVHEAIVNLTTNAAYAIGNAPGRITYEIEPYVMTDDNADAPGLAPGAYARLVVRDSGRGMDVSIMERMFDVFYTTKPAGEGTGLGLSMVHGIMKNHRGAVLARSEPGQGAEFALYFPAAEVFAVREAETAPSASTTTPGARVLYLDDEPALARIADRGLTRFGHAVTSFVSAHDAMEAFEQTPAAFDVVVTDLAMPHVTGFEFARHVLAIRPDMPVLMTTGWVNANDEREAAAIGISRLMLKPLGLADLHRAIVELADRKG